MSREEPRNPQVQPWGWHMVCAAKLGAEQKRKAQRKRGVTCGRGVPQLASDLRKVQQGHGIMSRGRVPLQSPRRLAGHALKFQRGSPARPLLSCLEFGSLDERLGIEPCRAPTPEVSCGHFVTRHLWQQYRRTFHTP
eukprot:300105-Hanusia_phi.AAC.1